MTLTPLIDKSLMFVRIWITQLGIGLPESGGAYLVTSEILDRIANAMVADLANFPWEGQAAGCSVAQGLTQWNSVAELEVIDKEVATVIAAQANQVMVARQSFYDIETYLRTMRLAAEAFLGAGQVAECRACELTAVNQVSPKMNLALVTLNDWTLRHTAKVAELNQQLAELLAKLTGEDAGALADSSTLSAVNAESAGALRQVASILRVDLMSLKQVVAFCFVTKKWLSRPDLVAAGVSQKVGATHGRYTEAFNGGLQMFEIRRAEVIQRLQQGVESRASMLDWTVGNFELTDEETAKLIQDAAEG